jgi:glycosyltransferase involved in cell wall biosynthesis
MLSFRLGGTDGVSVEAAKWSAALSEIGYEVTTVAGEGPVDHRVPGLEIGARNAPERAALRRALDGVDLVVVENLCSLPLNPRAAEAVAEMCRGRPTVLHHHDLSWQRPNLGRRPPPDDALWRHVTINELSRQELAGHRIQATTIYNRFDTGARGGDRESTRAALGIDRDARLLLFPSRAIPRKNVGAGLRLADRLGATFWLLGPAEDGYGPELESLVERSRCPVLRGRGEASNLADAYAAADLVVLPSSWEGFGNATVESAVHRRQLAVGPFPVGRELANFGFQWLSVDDADGVARWLDAPDAGVLRNNWEVADAHFSLRDLPRLIATVLATLPLGH